MISLADRYAADVFGLTYREFVEAKPLHYKWRVVAPAAVENLKRAHAEHWSGEKLADYLHADLEETKQSLRRYVMSKRVNAEGDAAGRISMLFQEWLSRFEPDERTRKVLALDLSRQLSSQLHVAALEGERLEDIIRKLEGPAGSAPSAGENPPAWGPQWKD